MTNCPIVNRARDMRSCFSSLMGATPSLVDCTNSDNSDSQQDRTVRVHEAHAVWMLLRVPTLLSEAVNAVKASTAAVMESLGNPKPSIVSRKAMLQLFVESTSNALAIFDSTTRLDFSVSLIHDADTSACRCSNDCQAETQNCRPTLDDSRRSANFEEFFWYESSASSRHHEPMVFDSEMSVSTTIDSDATSAALNSRSL
mmetsp:Transcript_27461/g.65942  ORF Transcript_27461/g.65942 Transcript_27461/m.65942 type:complete len:200 (-) Transcript_27461:2649-3248(-)